LQGVRYTKKIIFSSNGLLRKTKYKIVNRKAIFALEIIFFEASDCSQLTKTVQCSDQAKKPAKQLHTGMYILSKVCISSLLLTTTVTVCESVGAIVVEHFHPPSIRPELLPLSANILCQSSGAVISPLAGDVRPGMMRSHVLFGIGKPSLNTERKIRFLRRNFTHTVYTAGGKAKVQAI
jgi:hypothetical protein